MIMEIGEIYESDHLVTEDETAKRIGSGGLPVFSTPSMISLMENVSYLLAQRHGHQSVGTKVDISHLKACKVGSKVHAVAELLEIDGRRLRFKVCVTDEAGVVGEGYHERFMIDPERFMSKLG